MAENLLIEAEPALKRLRTQAAQFASLSALRQAVADAERDLAAAQAESKRVEDSASPREVKRARDAERAAGIRLEATQSEFDTVLERRSELDDQIVEAEEAARRVVAARLTARAQRQAAELAVLIESARGKQAELNETGKLIEAQFVEPLYNGFTRLAPEFSHRSLPGLCGFWRRHLGEHPIGTWQQLLTDCGVKAP